MVDRGLLALVLVVLMTRPSPAAEVEYFHLDIDGSVLGSSDEAGYMLETQRYLPFGELWSSTPGGQPLGFGAREFDVESGLSYFAARFFDAVASRFTSVDPVLDVNSGLLRDPQRWNRYSYARNNPFRYTDWDGLEVRYEGQRGSSIQRGMEEMAKRSETVRATLDQYSGVEGPHLTIKAGPVGNTNEAGQFVGDFARDPISKELTVKSGTITLREESQFGQSRFRFDRGTAAHELGHADQAKRDPAGFVNGLAEKDEHGKRVPWHKKPGEEHAERYKDKVEREMKQDHN